MLCGQKVPKPRKGPARIRCAVNNGGVRFGRQRREDTVNGHVGDRLILQGTHVGDHTRVGVITEVRNPDGTPPYSVHWLDNGHDSLVFPGSDAKIEQAPDQR